VLAFIYDSNLGPRLSRTDQPTMRAFIKSLVQGSTSKPLVSEPVNLPTRTPASNSAKEKAKAKMSKVKDAAKRKIFGAPPQAGVRPFTLQRDGSNQDTTVDQTDWEGFVTNISEPLTQLQLLSDGSSYFHRKCRACRTFLPLNVSLDTDLEGYCKKCKLWTCGGCGKSKGRGESIDIAPACCDAGRLFRLWVVLGKFDRRQGKLLIFPSSKSRRSSNIVRA